jgi:hypothetical protein
MTGSTGKAAAAFALDMRNIVRGRGFHQVQAVFDVSGNFATVFHYPGDICHSVGLQVVDIKVA